LWETEVLRENLPQIPHLTALFSNPGHCGGKLATNHLNYGLLFTDNVCTLPVAMATSIFFIQFILFIGKEMMMAVIMTSISKEVSTVLFHDFIDEV
jgi:hypothetical protein